MKTKFNLEAALSGEPFECVNKEYTILNWMYCKEFKPYPISCNIKDINGKVHLCGFTENGHITITNAHSDWNLVMSPKKVTRWFNVYANKDYGMIISSTVGFESEQDAKEYNSDKANYITTIPIEIELP